MPPHSVATQLKISSPIGTVSASANSIAKISKPSGIGAVYMFCIQASGPSTRDRQQREHRAAMAEQRLAREGRQHVRDHAGGHDHDQHVGAGEEEPGEMLVQERRAALAGVEEDAAVVAVDEQHRQRGEHHRADRQQQVAADPGRPRQQGHPPPGHPGRAHVVERDHEVDREADEAEDRERRSRRSRRRRRRRPRRSAPTAAATPPGRCRRAATGSWHRPSPPRPRRARTRAG